MDKKYDTHAQWNIIQAKEWNLVIYNNIDGTTDHYFKWNKRDTSASWSHNVESKKFNLMDVEDRLVLSRGQGE